MKLRDTFCALWKTEKQLTWLLCPSSLFPNPFPRPSFPRLSFSRPSFPCHTHPHIHTVHPDFCEMTVFGAAIAAGTAVEVWEDTSLLPEPATKQFQPALTSDGEDIAAL